MEIEWTQKQMSAIADAPITFNFAEADEGFRPKGRSANIEVQGEVSMGQCKLFKTTKSKP